MNRPRSLSPAVLLANSEVLVVGGTDGEGPIIGGQGDASAEIYDPSTGRWSYTASMEVPRYHATYTATALADGDVLVAGGMVLGTIDERINVTLPYAEIYHPATASWSPTGPMLLPTAYQSAVALPGGKVLVVGGVPSNHPDLAADALRSAEVYTPPASVVPPRSSATSPGTILRGALAGLAGAAVIITLAVIILRRRARRRPPPWWLARPGAPDARLRAWAARSALPEARPAHDAALTGGSASGC